VGNLLLQIGLVVLAGAVWLLLGGQVGWVDPATSDHWGPLALKASVGCLTGGFLLRVIAPMERKLRGSRCARCGAATEPGHLYCRDHMKKAMDELRDQTRDGMLRGRGTR
jgi:hypothetical protein